MAGAHRFHLHHPADLNNKTKQITVDPANKLPDDLTHTKDSLVKTESVVLSAVCTSLHCNATEQK